VARAAILTVGNEIVSGDTENTNASWLARRLAGLGVEVRLIAAIRDDVDEIAAFLRAEMPRVEHVFVTGGLGGTPAASVTTRRAGPASRVAPSLS